MYILNEILSRQIVLNNGIISTAQLCSVHETFW